MHILEWTHRASPRFRARGVKNGMILEAVPAPGMPHDYAEALVRPGLTGRAPADGERVRGGSETALDRVFYDLDDYVTDSSLRDPDDMSDAELRSRVRRIVEELTSATR
ncbi:hypothetical protein [Streptomyces sp. NPDC001070]